MIETPIRQRPVALPADVRSSAEERGWSTATLERALRLGFQRRDLEFWLEGGRRPEQVEEILERRQRLVTGTMHVREANWMDNAALIDAFGDSPAVIGDRLVTMERSPYAFAQFWLAENPSLQVIEDQGVILAIGFHSVRNTVVAGQRIAVDFLASARVRQELRGRDFSRMLQEAPRLWSAPVPTAKYYYLHSQNFASQRWLDKIRPDIALVQERHEDEVSGVPVSVSYFAPSQDEADKTGIRRARRADLRACVALINRTHRAQDLFRPYTVEYLTSRLDDHAWGLKPAWAPRVYDWDDYYVLEQDGRIVACGGLWDRGANVREVWRDRGGNVLEISDPTALLDFGYTEEQEPLMARLVRYFLAETAAKARSALLAPFEQLPRLRELLSALQQQDETRFIHWGSQKLPLRRPYTDLSYW